MDLSSGRFYFSLNRPTETQTSIEAYVYGAGDDPLVLPLWGNDTLEGGTATSPVLSADGSILYVCDQADHLLALDTRKGGEERWRFDLGFSPLGSFSVSDQGVIIPTGALGAETMAPQDMSDHVVILWRKGDLFMRSIAAQTANGLADPFRDIHHPIHRVPAPGRSSARASGSH